MPYEQRYNIHVFLGSGETGRQRRLRLEKEAREHGFVRGEKVILAPYIVARLEGKLKSKKF